MVSRLRPFPLPHSRKRAAGCCCALPPEIRCPCLQTAHKHTPSIATRITQPPATNTTKKSAMLADVVALVAGGSSADSLAAVRARLLSLGARAPPRLTGTTTHIVFCRGGGGRGSGDAELRALHDRVALVRRKGRERRERRRSMRARLRHSPISLSLSLSLIHRPAPRPSSSRPPGSKPARGLGTGWRYARNGRERGGGAARKTLERAVGPARSSLNLLLRPSPFIHTRKPPSSSPSRPAGPP